MTSTTLSGIHPVLEALRANQPIDRVLIAKGAGGPRLQQIIHLCRERNVAVRFEQRASLDRLSKTGAHQGVVAVGAPQQYAQPDDIIASAKMLVILDGIEDPHNLGAIIRSAHAAGADAAIIPERRAAPLTEVAAKAAAGALAHFPVIKTTNLNRQIEDLKKKGYWIYGMDERGEHDYDTVEYTEPCALVMGAEGGGLHQQVANHCDFLIKIPLAGKISSLNVSVAAGIALFDWKRRRK